MAFNRFRALGSERYQRALELLRQNTTGVFTKSQGYDINHIDKLTESQKRKVRSYWKEFDKLTSRPYTPVIIRDKEKLKAVQKAALHQKYLGKFKAAFIPSDGKTDAHIKYDKNSKIVTIKLGAITRQVFAFNKKLLIQDPLLAVQDIMKRAKGAEVFKIQCGQFEYNAFSSNYDVQLANTITLFQQKYANSGKWLHGLTAYYYKDKKEFFDSINKIQKSREALATKRRLARNATKRADKLK